jgi:N6-adenosine-specific RNA methylase IME4
MGYGLMTMDAIFALGQQVVDWAADDAHLYLWATPVLHRNGDAVAVVEAWGFEVVSEIIWAKPNFGLGRFPRPQHEPLLVCRRGRLPFAVNDAGSVQRWNQSHAKTNGGKVHSAKPDGALDLIERASPGPYLELFARRARFGWDYWGDESLGTAEMPEVAA